MIKLVYPKTTVLLCWWHMLCEMQMHFHMEEFLKLWEHIQESKCLINQSLILCGNGSELIPQSPLAL